MIDVVKKIDELRKARGWTIYKLSAETGLTQQAIHAWYNSNKMSMPSIPTLEIVCEAFGITMADFFTEKYIVEMTPHIKALYDNWCGLSNEERIIIDSLVRKLISRK
jgi:transcriptional regulator with XRE-family HTH domain